MEAKNYFVESVTFHEPKTRAGCDWKETRLAIRIHRNGNSSFYRRASRPAFGFRSEKIGRFAASAVDVTFAFPTFGVERPRRNESQTIPACVLYRRQTADIVARLLRFNLEFQKKSSTCKSIRFYRLQR